MSRFYRNRRLLISLLLSGGQAANPLLTDFISYWSLDEVSGTRADSTDTGNDLTDNNMVGSTTGLISNAASFNAANSESLSRADNESLSLAGSEFTFSLWFFYDTDTLISNSTLLSKLNGFNATSCEYILQYFTTNQVRLRMGDGTNFQTVNVSTTGLTEDAWAHVLFGWDGTNSYVRLNDTTESTMSLNTTIDTVADFKIGRGNDGEYFTGAIDEVGFWKRTLTSAEKTFLYNGGSGRSYADILAYTG